MRLGEDKDDRTSEAYGLRTVGPYIRDPATGWRRMDSDECLRAFMERSYRDIMTAASPFASFGR